MIPFCKKCRGTGYVVPTDETCPKCKGRGE